MYSYDDVWELFLNNYKADDTQLPESDDVIYDFIRNAVKLLNNRLDLDIIADDTTETLIGMQDDDELLLTAHYIRLVFLMNDRKYYESLWQPFSTDVGLRNFGTQLTSLKESVREQREMIEEIIRNQMEDFL